MVKYPKNFVKKYQPPSFLTVIIPACIVYVFTLNINSVAKASSNINMSGCYVNKELFQNINNFHHSTQVQGDYLSHDTSEAI